MSTNKSTSNGCRNRKQGFLYLLFMAAFVTAFQLNVNSQSLELEISPLRFAGVHSLSSVQGESDAYMVLHTASEGNWNFQLIDNKLDEVRTGTIEAPRYSFFTGMTYNGEHILLSFIVNAFSQSITYVVLDKQGFEVARTTRTDTPMLRRGDRFFPGVFNHPQQGFVIVQTTGRGRRAGYSVEQVDAGLNTLWSMEFAADKGTAHVYDLVAGNDKLFILEATERMGRTLNARLHCIDLFENEHTYTMELGDGDHSYFPTAFLPMENGNIAMAGTYFNGSRIRGKNTRGLFFLNVGPEGSTEAMEMYPWRELRRTLRTPVPDWFFKVMPDVYIHALELNNDGSLTAVAELYRYSGEVRSEDSRGRKEQYHRIRMLDFMLFGFDQAGGLQYTERIERPHMVLKLDSEFSGGSESLAHNAGQGPLRRARAMKEAGAFTYRFHQMTDNSFNLAFVSYEAKTHYAYFMDLNKNFNAVKTELRHAKPAIISYYQIIDLCANQSGFGFILSELNTRSFDDSEANWRGLLPSVNGSMVTYEYMPLTGKLKLNRVILTDSQNQLTN